MSQANQGFNVAWICQRCGTQFQNSPAPPATCAICTDSRQFVGPDGQQWTTLEQLRATHGNRFTAEERGVYSLHTEPAFGIGQRAFLIQSAGGNILWDCLSLLDDETIQRIRALGGIAHIAISHPHYYTTMIEWSLAFDAPIHLHARDRAWVMRPHPNIHFWDSETCSLDPTFTLLHTPGHFDGFQVLHWSNGGEGKGALFAGDQPQVCMDSQWLSFMYSYPNYVPLGSAQVEDILRRLAPWKFDRIYGAFANRTVQEHAQERLRLSAERYLAAIRR